MMKNLSVRTALLAILVTFACMIVFGAGVGVLALRAADQATSRVEQLSAGALLLNDAYKDMTRARSALARAYASAREGSTEVNTGALDAAGKSLKRSDETLQRFAAAPLLEGQDDAQRRQVVDAARRHAGTVERALAALRAGDPPPTRRSTTATSPLPGPSIRRASSASRNRRASWRSRKPRLAARATSGW